MKIKLILNLLLMISITSYGQMAPTDANIIGHVVYNSEHIPFASVMIKGTNIGITTDETGHYQLINLTPGTYTIRVTYIGYKPKEIVVSIHSGETKEVHFELETDFLGLEEVVITGDRSETNRRESSSIVNTVSSKMFASTQSVTLSEGLNFSPGLRMENNCQNCGFSQVRMNGMEGPYSQILINSRPIFSGLAGVYGLELIPAAMIDRVEIIRGGGSALYGSNAIAGTINLILKDPISNTYEFGFNNSFTGIDKKYTGNAANDFSTNFNTSLVSSDNKSGMALYGFFRDKDPFDANNDGFSEISLMNNITVGSRIFHRFDNKKKLIFDFFNINEERRGGDKFDLPLHETSVSEAVSHKITTGAVTYEQFFRKRDLFSLYTSTQRVNRNSYYGAHQSLKDYGNTKDLSYVIGAQYNASFGNSNLIIGIEKTGSALKDIKLGYPDYEKSFYAVDSVLIVPHVDNVLVSDQATTTNGLFAQYEINYRKFKFSTGARFDNFSVINKEQIGAAKTGNVLSPRISVKYDIKSNLQGRFSYSQGYRAPQIFDEDLHIETSGSRQVLHRNSPDLTQETSHSFMASLDFNKKFNRKEFGLLIEGFYTKLINPFSNIFSAPDENGSVIYTRINATEGAVVQGVNIEFNFVPSFNFALKSGFTFQTSKYESIQEFNENRFFRTPSDYGYLSADWNLWDEFGIAFTVNYTGKMLIPYFGINQSNPESGELRVSNRFVDLGLKLKYNLHFSASKIQLFIGIKNILNSYQSDFDLYIDRDPGYIYGPAAPRTIYLGMKMGNFIL